MTIWFTADLHLGHKNILKYCNRPWQTIEEHDAAILANWKETVGENDLVFVLGDIVMGSIKKYADRLAELPGEKRLVCGNHDAVWMGHESSRTASDYKALARAGFHSISQYDVIANANYLGWDSNRIVHLSHFPSEGESVDGRPDRFEEYRPTIAGRIILCGHVHDQWVRKGNNINVGVDVWGYRPVNASTLGAIVDMEPIRE